MTHSLKPWNTFGIDHCAKHIVCAENEQQLLSAWQQATREGLPVMILVGKQCPVSGKLRRHRDP